ncbi:MAG TPA: AMP-binding protein [Geodermatophilus sp.]|nr:AMP-binding protein [Geodermatophilus sp.]
MYRSDRPLSEIPSTLLSAHVLRDAAGRGDRPALVDAATGETISFAELLAQADAGAAGLASDGLRPGDVVGLMSHNQPRYAVAVHAVLRAGGVISPLNPALTAGEIGKQLGHSRARALIVAEPFVEKAYEAIAGTGIDRVYVLGDHSLGRPFSDLARGTGTLPALDLDPASALAVLPYSSGTTGLSKGVMLTHRNLVANLEQMRVGWRMTEDDVVCGVLPFFHIYGFTIILNSALMSGTTIVTMPRFDLRGFLEVVQQHRVTRGHFAPPLVLALATAPEVDEYDLSSLRRAVSGAAPLDEELAARAEARTGCVIRQGYGMTEASPGTHLVYDDDFSTTPPGSVGKLVPGTEARLVDPATGEDVAAGETGELLVRGPQVMLGYLDNPGATAETITDGWLHTGDIARADENGDFYIVDRLKELIKYKGYQVAPAELEAVLLTHPDVLDAAVIAVPDAAAGEVPKAFVVTRRELDPDVLVAFVAERVAPYKKLRALEFIAEIPKSPAGKILRRVLKARDAAARSAIAGG